MDQCRLVKPDSSYETDIRAFREEMIGANSSIDGAGPLKRMENVSEWLAFTRALENIQTVPSNWVVSEQFLYVRESDHRIVGMIQFRHELNDFLEKYGGHIGYSVRPSERRKGYAKAMLSDCLQIIRTYGLQKALISCTPENEGSRRTILANGGVYESTVYYAADNVFLERYWINLHR